MKSVLARYLADKFCLSRCLVGNFAGLLIKSNVTATSWANFIASLVVLTGRLVKVKRIIGRK